ncbi:hypothetical protein [Hanstruepera marina]|uniref:hypothetical protein n=1 Tax=Hanstruepera marina TaxID=2873265 RepID=UPI001CA6FB59|nr:hypothetical protein [Hanstruepera marina]
MKNLALFSKVIILSLLFTLGSCSSTDDNDSTGGGGIGGGGTGGNVNTQIDELKTTMATGSWVVTFYFDTDHEETNNFTTFSFIFNPQGSINASNGVDTYNGTWSVTPDSSGDGDIDFNISFASPPDFEEISDDWDVTFYSDVKLELRDVSGGNGGTDLLTFERL